MRKAGKRLKMQDIPGEWFVKLSSSGNGHTYLWPKSVKPHITLFDLMADKTIYSRKPCIKKKYWKFYFSKQGSLISQVILMFFTFSNLIKLCSLYMTREQSWHLGYWFTKKFQMIWQYHLVTSALIMKKIWGRVKYTNIYSSLVATVFNLIKVWVKSPLFMTIFLLSTWCHVNHYNFVNYTHNFI